MSSAGITRGWFVLLLLAGVAAGMQPQQAPSAPAGNARGNASPADARPVDLAQLFERGQDALNQGRLDEAERDFQQVLQIDPQAGGAYANLGVVSMRRKHWSKALERLQKAERLLPQVAGIRLNIGLAYFRQNEFLKAIPPFESVVSDEPDGVQPRYLLGLCYFFAERWADAAATLEPLWTQESGQLPYLYVLSNAAHRAGRQELDERATERLIQLGNDSAEYHLFVGKYHLNLEQYDMALAEFEAAAKADPRLPFVHFNLGLTFLRKHEYEQARDEFLKDAAIEPDLALDYDELGDVYWQMQDDSKAEKSYREALLRNGRLVNSRLGLTKIYERQGKYAQALAEADAAVKIDPARTDAHYMRGQLLLRMGRKMEAKKELEAVNRNNQQRAQAEAGTVPSPELLQDQQ